MASYLCILLIGYGSIGRRHCANLQRLAPTVKIVVVEPDRGRYVLAPKIEFVTDWPQLGRSFDLCVICSPNNLHAQHIEMAQNIARFIFVEKPFLDRIPSDVTGFTSAITCPLMVACNYRFEPGLLLVKQALAQGCIGRPLHVFAEYGNYLPDWRPGFDYRRNYGASRANGGGVTLDRIHELDFLSWLFGPVTAVRGYPISTGQLEINTEDMIDIVLSFAHGMQGVVHVNYLRRTYHSSMRILGSVGTLTWNFSPSVVVVEKEDGIEYLRHVEVPDTNEMYLEQMRYVLICLECGHAPINGPTEALEILDTALAARDGRS